ncbi:MAG: ImmA/IrrE family metallo-endopeptidase [Betaproteobacteria bacterium]|nr:ImmA/IrrE family metallo-endopeptidase [Betaproteobacteria bacterium]
MGIRRTYIRTLAEKVLHKHQPRGLPIDPTRIAEAYGIEVKVEDVDDEDISGFLLRESKLRKTIIGANARHHENRQRFTIAHELGHYLLHKGESVHLDERKPGFMLQLRDANSSTGESINEREANLFAAELLMPARLLEKDLRGKKFDLLGDDFFLRKLAKGYGVSVQALTIRLENLGYVLD